MKIQTKFLLFTAFAGAISTDGQAAHAEIVPVWWGQWDTNNYNRWDTKNDPPQDKPPAGVYPPSPEFTVDANGKEITSWKWTPVSGAADPLDAGWVRGANRSVFWKPVTSSPNYRQVEGVFEEPNINRLVASPNNKPTYYFGLKGTINGNLITTDCGIQWETYAGNLGWTLVHRVTINVPGKGTWSLWKPIPAIRYPKGRLGSINLKYEISRNNTASVSFYSPAWGQTEVVSSSYYNPNYPVQFEHLRRNVGLTQATNLNPNDPNTRVIPGNGAVYLDGSIITNLRFSEGVLSTYPKVNASDPEQIRQYWLGATNQGPTENEHVSSDSRGMSDVLRPPTMVDGRYLIDFAPPFTSPQVSSRDPQNAFNYQTGFKAENVIITMGSLKARKHVVSLPKPLKGKVKR